MIKKHTLWICLAAATFPACSNDSQPEPDDIHVDVPDTDGDDGVEAPPNSVELGGLCNSDVSCKSAFCVKIGQGFNEGICTQRCDEEDDCAQSGWSCTIVNSGTGDQVNACIPENLCIDKDGDQYGIGPGCLGPDCDDDNPLVNPGAPEICNGIDDNCDGIVDNNLVDVNRFCDTDRPGICADGRTFCDNGQLTCSPLRSPEQEVCNGLDDDCDGLIDETQRMDENNNFVVGIGTACTVPDAQGTCNIGERVCDPARGGILCVSNNDPQDEICNGIDDNCDGQPDSGVVGLGEPCTAGFGVCQTLGVRVCDPFDATAAPICDNKPNEANAGPEICDYIDNNCDGQIDEDFKDENGQYASVEYCGSCDVNCHRLWNDQADSLHVVPTCTTTPTSAVCSFVCVDGWVDADGEEDNGCELQPDGEAIYVNTPQKGGGDSATCGAWNAPCATITHGIVRAKAEGRSRVRVGQGIYREGVRLEDGISLLGGHNALNWTRDTRTYATILTGAVPDITTDSVGIAAHGIQTPTEVSGFTVTAPDGRNGGSSIAVWVKDSTDALRITENTLMAGHGGQGATGAAGNNGANGNNGSAGVEGVTANNNCAGRIRQGGAPGASSCGDQNVAGGRGSDGICADYGGPGAVPAPGNAVAGGGASGEAGLTAWGRGYNGSSCTNDPAAVDYNFPRDGQAGGSGTDGSGGAGASSSTGSLTADGMWRAASGSPGSPGTPGGGGGGGGASHSVQRCTGENDQGLTGCNANADRWIGSSGGGGGAGGCSGTAAQGGTGGGGSFGLLITHDGQASLPVISSNSIARNYAGQGGDGGIGGNGGTGGRGGVGGDASLGDSTLSFCAKNGRRGGDGGRGGHGGGGGGGAGGSSYDVLVQGVSAAELAALEAANEFLVPPSTDTFGSGGPGGGSMGNPGLNGTQGSSGRSLRF